MQFGLSPVHDVSNLLEGVILTRLSSLLNDD